MTDSVRVRFAPSPTGPIHIGNMHTTLFNWLFARHHQGVFVLRIEDTDLERSGQDYEEIILDELRWLGLEWDEGPAVGGDYGPYRQTERTDIYHRYVKRLQETGQIYPCYCSPQEIEAERQAARKAGKVYHYSGRCRQLTSGQRREREREGREPVWRFKVPAGEVVTFQDLVYGDISFPTDDIGDFVVVRSNGMPLYNFAVVVDDTEMEISHVIRGEDHLSNTPVQLLLYQALGIEPPAFAHLPHVLGQGGKKLSKRTGLGYVGDYRQRGYLPEAMFNYLALVGWTPASGSEQEFFSRQELIDLFRLDRVNRSSAHLDVDKLNWVNAHYIRQADLSELVELALPFYQQAGLVGDEPDRDWLAEVIDLVRDGVQYLEQLPQQTAFVFNDDIEPQDEEAEAALESAHVQEVLAAFAAKIEALDELTPDATRTLFKELRDELPYGARKIFMPVRVTLTGSAHGPEIYRLVPVLGKQRVLRRIQNRLNAQL